MLKQEFSILKSGSFVRGLLSLSMNLCLDNKDNTDNIQRFPYKFGSKWTQQLKERSDTKIKLENLIGRNFEEAFIAKYRQLLKAMSEKNYGVLKQMTQSALYNRMAKSNLDVKLISEDEPVDVFVFGNRSYGQSYSNQLLFNMSFDRKKFQEKQNQIQFDNKQYDKIMKIKSSFLLKFDGIDNCLEAFKVIDWKDYQLPKRSCLLSIPIVFRSKMKLIPSIQRQCQAQSKKMRENQYEDHIVYFEAQNKMVFGQKLFNRAISKLSHPSNIQKYQSEFIRRCLGINKGQSTKMEGYKIAAIDECLWLPERHRNRKQTRPNQ